MITVLVVSVRPISAVDGTLHVLKVIDQATGATGSMIVTAADSDDLFGGRAIYGEIAVHRDRVT